MCNHDIVSCWNTTFPPLCLNFQVDIYFFLFFRLCFLLVTQELRKNLPVERGSSDDRPVLKDKNLNKSFITIAFII